MKRAKEAMEAEDEAIEIRGEDVKTRPCIILSDNSHPFFPKQYVVVGITTTDWLIENQGENPRL
jgi:hypothetical protein